MASGGRAGWCQGGRGRGDADFSRRGSLSSKKIRGEGTEPCRRKDAEGRSTARLGAAGGAAAGLAVLGLLTAPTCRRARPLPPHSAPSRRTPPEADPAQSVPPGAGVVSASPGPQAPAPRASASLAASLLPHLPPLFSLSSPSLPARSTPPCPRSAPPRSPRPARVRSLLPQPRPASRTPIPSPLRAGSRLVMSGWRSGSMSGSRPPPTRASSR